MDLKFFNYSICFVIDIKENMLLEFVFIVDID